MFQPDCDERRIRCTRRKIQRASSSRSTALARERNEGASIVATTVVGEAAFGNPDPLNEARSMLVRRRISGIPATEYSTTLIRVSVTLGAGGCGGLSITVTARFTCSIANSANGVLFRQSDHVDEGGRSLLLPPARNAATVGV